MAPAPGSRPRRAIEQGESTGRIGGLSLTGGLYAPRMPTTLREAGFRFYFYSSDRREPPHVHVDRGGASAKIWLERVEVARNIGFAAQELGDIVRLVRGRRTELLEAWHVHFASGTRP